MTKSKLAGYDRIAIIVQRGKEYAYALYDDSVKEHDSVCVDGAARDTIWEVSRIIPATPEAIGIYDPTREVICKIDASAYKRRKKERREAAKLERQRQYEKLSIGGRRTMKKNIKTNDVLGNAWGVLQNITKIIKTLEDIGLNVDGDNKTMGSLYHVETNAVNLIQSEFNVDASKREEADNTILSYVGEHIRENIIGFPEELADKLHKLAPKSSHKEYWVVFESQHDQKSLYPEDRGLISNYDCVAVFDNEKDAMDFEAKNALNRVRKLVKIPSEMTGFDKEDE